MGCSSASVGNVAQAPRLMSHLQHSIFVCFVRQGSILSFVLDIPRIVFSEYFDILPLQVNIFYTVSAMALRCMNCMVNPCVFSPEMHDQLLQFTGVCLESIYRLPCLCMVPTGLVYETATADIRDPNLRCQVHVVHLRFSGT